MLNYYCHSLLNKNSFNCARVWYTYVDIVQKQRGTSNTTNKKLSSFFSINVTQNLEAVKKKYIIQTFISGCLKQTHTNNVNKTHPMCCDKSNLVSKNYLTLMTSYLLHQTFSRLMKTLWTNSYASIQNYIQVIQLISIFSEMKYYFSKLTSFS